ncbi:AI-2E family transporter [Nitratifractor sp.]
MPRKTPVSFYFFYLSALVVIVAGLKMAAQAVIILFLSIFIASILSPLMLGMERRGVPRVLAFLLILSLVLGGLFFMVTVVANSFEGFMRNLPAYEQKLRELAQLWSGRLGEMGFAVDPKLILESLDLRTFVAMGGRAAGNIGIFLSKALLVAIGVAFILFETPHFGKKLELIFGGREESLRNFSLFSHTIQKYFSIKTFTSMLTGVAITVALLFFDIQYAVLWGVLGFLLNFIPVIGSLIAAIPAILLALFYKDLGTVLWVVVIYILINNLISNVLEPKIMGDGLGLSPAVIFFSLIFWGWVLGPVGMFLAVPLTMTLKIAFDSNERTRWIGILMSNPRKS